MNELESLRRLTEAVETAKADIAPTYIEYVHLAFAIATDCGEEGRDFFHRLCRVSAKYQREHAERIFSNALTANHGDMHGHGVLSRRSGRSYRPQRGGCKQPDRYKRYSRYSAKTFRTHVRA